MRMRVSVAIAILLLLVGCGRVEEPEAVKPPEAVTPSPEEKAGQQESPDQEAPDAPEEFQPFAFSFALPDTKGKTVSLDDFQGKVVIVDFWGTWCPPCRKEVPHFVALHQKYRGDGLEIVGINYEQGPQSEWIGMIEAFAKENGITYPCVIGDGATRERVPDFEGYPTTLLIDRTGAVRAKLVGYRPYEQLDALVRKLLAAASP